MFAEGPLCVAVSVGEFEEGEKWKRKEAFGYFGEDWGEVDGAVVVGVVFRSFLVQWSEPVEFPEFGSFGCGKYEAC